MPPLGLSASRRAREYTSAALRHSVCGHFCSLRNKDTGNPNTVFQIIVQTTTGRLPVRQNVKFRRGGGFLGAPHSFPRRPRPHLLPSFPCVCHPPCQTLAWPQSEGLSENTKERTFGGRLWGVGQLGEPVGSSGMVVGKKEKRVWSSEAWGPPE